MTKYANTSPSGTAAVVAASTFFSMFAFFGLYWSAFGWALAAGLVVSIYIHEMGHVFQLRREGIEASAPTPSVTE